MDKFNKLEKKVPMPKGSKVNSEYPTGGTAVEMSKPTESQTEKVRGQKRMLAEKKRSATWY